MQVAQAPGNRARRDARGPARLAETLSDVRNLVGLNPIDFVSALLRSSQAVVPEDPVVADATRSREAISFVRPAFTRPRGDVVRCTLQLEVTMRFDLILALLAFVPACGDDSSGNDVADVVEAADLGPDGSDVLDDAAADADADDEGADDAAGDVVACDGGCEAPLLCCDDRCVNPSHDPAHCGGCRLPCSGETPFCDYGTCAPQPCDGPALCGMRPCCGSTCCEEGQVCCVVAGGPIGPPSCYDDICPAGCPWCP